jgi:hypothetical protein
VITQHIENKFAQMGARVKFRTELESRWRIWPVTRFSLDVREDKRGTFFELSVPAQDAPEMQVLEVRPELRHLLLLVRQEGRKDKFLCGHDERHWFTCAVPGDSVSSIRTAFAALKPREVLEAEQAQTLSEYERQRRRNRAYRRQGEWFFLPQPEFSAQGCIVHRNEPIRRGSGKPHWCEELVRGGGDLVYVSFQHPNGLTQREYEKLLERNPSAKRINWSRMVRDAGVYVRGRISHPDHATIVLLEWHRVLMNSEHQAAAARNVAFLD